LIRPVITSTRAAGSAESNGLPAARGLLRNRAISSVTCLRTIDHHAANSSSLLRSPAGFPVRRMSSIGCVHAGTADRSAGVPPSRRPLPCVEARQVTHAMAAMSLLAPLHSATHQRRAVAASFIVGHHGGQQVRGYPRRSTTQSIFGSHHDQPATSSGRRLEAGI